MDYVKTAGRKRCAKLENKTANSGICRSNMHLTNNNYFRIEGEERPVQIKWFIFVSSISFKKSSSKGIKLYI